MSDAAPISVVFLDGGFGVAEALERLLGGHPDLAFRGCFRTTEELFYNLSQGPIEVVVVNRAILPAGGVQAFLDAVTGICPATRVVMWFDFPLYARQPAPSADAARDVPVINRQGPVADLLAAIRRAGARNGARPPTSSGHNPATHHHHGHRLSG